MRFFVDIRIGEMLPRGYGVAWYRPEYDVARCAPVPVNLVIGLVRKVYNWCRRGVKPSVMEQIEEEKRRLGDQLVRDREAAEKARKMSEMWRSSYVEQHSVLSSIASLVDAPEAVEWNDLHRIVRERLIQAGYPAADGETIVPRVSDNAKEPD